MAGGLGDDTYWVANTGNVVVENEGEGIDTVKSSISYTLGANVENLTLTGYSNINGTGNSLDNMLIGNGYMNTLFGGVGDDTLDGGAGNDQLYGDTGNDILTGGAGADVYWFLAGFGNDTITASTSNKLDSINLSGFNSSQAMLSLIGADLTLTIDGTDSIFMTGWGADASYKLSTVIFSDGAKTLNSAGTGWM